MASTVAAVPTLYTCFFAYADPLIALYGAYLNFLAAVASMVPRVSEDLAVWKVLQFSLLLSDAGGLSGVYFALERQGRLEPRLWSADDRAVGGLYLFITAVRLAFVLGVGFGGAGEVRRGDKRR